MVKITGYLDTNVKYHRKNPADRELRVACAIVMSTWLVPTIAQVCWIRSKKSSPFFAAAFCQPACGSGESGTGRIVALAEPFHCKPGSREWQVRKRLSRNLFRGLRKRRRRFRGYGTPIPPGWLREGKCEAFYGRKKCAVGSTGYSISYTFTISVCPEMSIIYPKKAYYSVQKWSVPVTQISNYLKSLSFQLRTLNQITPSLVENESSARIVHTSNSPVEALKFIRVPMILIVPRIAISPSLFRTTTSLELPTPLITIIPLPPLENW